MTTNTTAEVSEAMIELVEELRIAKRDMELLPPHKKQAMEGTTGFSANACAYLYGKAAAALAMQSERLKGDGEAERLLRDAEDELRNRAVTDDDSAWLIANRIRELLSPPSDGVSRDE